MEEIGGSIRSSAVVGVASALILRENLRRKGLLLINDSPNVIYLSKILPAILNQGIRLNPNGGSYQEPSLGSFIWRGQWYAIATVAASILAMTEDF